MAKATSATLDPDQPYCDAMQDMIGTQWMAVWKAIPAVLSGKDPEAVHQVRVASRRLRAAMDVATPCFPRTWYRPLHKTAKAITQSLGEVRDRDVLLAALVLERARASDDTRPGLDELIAGLRRERKQARKVMRRFLAKLESQHVARESRRRFPTGKKDHQGGKRGAQAASRLKAQGRLPEVFPPTGVTPPAGQHLSLPLLDVNAALATNARLVLAVRVDELFIYESIIPDATATELLHDARIATKRLRYTLELFSSVFGEEGEAIVGNLQSVQEVLGQLHDCDVRIERIEHLLGSLGDSPERAELMISFDALVQQERRRRIALHGAVLDSWHELEREQVKQRLGALTCLQHESDVLATA